MPVERKRSRQVVLAQSAVAATAPADTNENVLATIPVPGGAMGLNGRLLITTQWTITSSANNKILRVRFSGAAGTLFLNGTFTTSATARMQTEIANRNAANSQVGGSSLASGTWGGSTGAIVTAAVDTAADTTLVIAGTKASGAETITLESYSVELYV